MTEDQFTEMTKELKGEFDRMVKANLFDGVFELLRKYHPVGFIGTSDAQVMVVSEYIKSDESREELIPLCAFMTTRNINNTYGGVGFGMIPKGKIKMKIPGKTE